MGLEPSFLAMFSKLKNLIVGGSNGVKRIELYCAICFEEGKLRSCCKTVYCDYDYSKNKSCPNCHNDTKKDKISGAVFMVSKYSEFEECRICLAAGLKRRCCGNYYCDDCYCKYVSFPCMYFFGHLSLSLSLPEVMCILS